MTKFQIILLSVFGFFILLAVAVFALYKGGGASQKAFVVVWGDLPAEAVSTILDTQIPALDKNLTVQYVEKSSDAIDQEFTEALATGVGPDLLILTQDKFWETKSKLVAIPYESIGERDFKETFVEEGELFMAEEGIYALPLVVDPMVLYYNRDLLSAAGEAKPVAYWDEIYPLTLKLTRRDAAGNLIESTIALGETRNIKNYKSILSLLFLQAGTPVTAWMGTDLRSVLNHNFEQTIAPGEAALDFYTQFSNPTKAYYSWNRTMPEAQTHFTSGDSAYYLGFASELGAIRGKNPNLNFSLAPVPQSRVSGRKITYGELYAVGITRGTRDVSAALRAALILVSQDIATPVSSSLSLPSARRDLLSVRQSDVVKAIFNEAALQSRGWIDPKSDGTQKLFGEMVDQITSGRTRTAEALSAGSVKLDNLIK